MNILTIQWEGKKVQLPVSEVKKVCLELCSGLVPSFQAVRARELCAALAKHKKVSCGRYNLTIQNLP
jgi:hypothetical protein